MPESRYGAKPIYSLNDDPEAKHVESVLNSSQGTVGYANSDATEEDWPVDIEEAKGTVESDSTHSAKKARKATKQPRQKCARQRIIRASPSQHVFDLQLHGLKCRSGYITFHASKRGVPNTLVMYVIGIAIIDSIIGK